MQHSIQIHINQIVKVLHKQHNVLGYALRYAKFMAVICMCWSTQLETFPTERFPIMSIAIVKVQTAALDGLAKSLLVTKGSRRYNVGANLV